MSKTLFLEPSWFGTGFTNEIFLNISKLLVKILMKYTELKETDHKISQCSKTKARHQKIILIN